MRIIGIDPGYAIVGYGVLDYEKTRFSVVNYGAITTAAGTSFDRRLMEIYDDMCTVLDMFKPDCMSIEKLYFTNNKTTGIDVAQARGIILLTAVQRDGYLFTKVTRKVDIIHPLVLLPQPAEAFQRSVAAAIIDKQDFPLINGIAVDKLYQTLIQSGQHRFLIIYRNQKSHFLHIILHYHKDSSKILLLFENKPH